MIVVRLFNTVGPRQSGAYGMVLPRFVGQAPRDQDVTVHGDGTQTRCFVHVANTVRALAQLLDKEAALGSVYNVGSSEPVAVIDLARRVIEQTGSRSRITLVPYEQASERGFEEVGHRVPDTAALRDLTRWIPTRGLDEMIGDVGADERNRLTATKHVAIAG
jgi:UDP-glucose 4-epimerase